MAPHTPRQPGATRREKAAATRRRIRDTAQRLFLAHGYAATSMDSIARHAGVAVQTTYYTFSTKLGLLKELVDVAVAGDDDPVPTLQRPWVTDAIAAAPPAQIAIQAAAARQISERVAPVLHALRGAATADAEAAELWRANRNQFRAVHHHLIKALADKAPLRGDIDVETATDITVAILGIDNYQLLVGERQWPAEKWQRWATSVLQQQLLVEPAEVPAAGPTAERDGGASRGEVPLP